MRWNIKRTKLILALIPIISIIFFVLTANDSIYANQSFSSFDIYMHICDTQEPIEGKDSPNDYTAAENFAIAARVFLNTDSVQGSVSGTVTALGGFYTQNVINYRSKTGGEIFNESVSLSALASVAEQRYFKDGAILFRKGNTKGSTVTGWDDSVVEIAPAVYRQRYGVVPQEITKYSVTKDTIIGEKFVSENDDGTFTYELELDAEKAQKYARYEMMTYAGVDEYPTFHACRITFTVDENWRILEMTTYDSYDIAIMNGIRCESNLTETFTYEEGYIPERAQIFVDYVPTGNTGDVVKEKGPADYLSEAFGSYISGAKDLCVDASLTLEGEKLDLAARIDIKNMNFAFSLGNGIYAYYSGDEVFLSLGENGYRIKISELTPLLEKFGVKTGELQLDAGLLEVLFENYSLVENDTHIHILMPFELFGLKLDVDMGLYKLDNGLTTADTIEATVSKGNFTLPLSVHVVDEVDIPELVESDYVSLAPALGAVANTLSLDSFALDGSVTVNGNDINLSALIVKENKDVAVSADVSVAGIDARLTYKSGDIYAQIGGVTVKAATNEIGDIAEAISALVPSLSGDGNSNAISEILPHVLPADLSLQTVLDLLTRVSYADGKLTVSIKPEIGDEWTLSLTHGNILSSLALSPVTLGGVTVSAALNLSDGKGGEVAVPQGPYAEASELVSLLPSVTELINAKSYAVELAGSVSLGETEISVSGNAEIVPSPLAVKASLCAGGIAIDAVYVGDTLYLTAGELTVSATMSEIEELVALFGASLPDLGSAANIDVLALLHELLDSITLYTVNGGLFLAYDADNLSAEAFLKSDNGLQANVSLSSDAFSLSLDATVKGLSTPGQIDVPTGNILPLSSVTRFIEPIMNTLKRKAFLVRIDGSITSGDLGETISGVITVNTGDSLELAGSVKLSGANVEFILKNNTVYLRAGAAAFKLAFDDASGLLGSVESAFGSLDNLADTLEPLIGENAAKAIRETVEKVDGVLSSLTGGEKTEISDILDSLGFVLPELNIDSLASLIASANIEDGKLTLPVTTTQGGSYTVTVEHDGEYLTGASISDLEIFGLGAELSLTLECSDEYPVEIGDDEYFDLATLSDVLAVLPDILSARAFELNITEGVVNSSLLSGNIIGTVLLSLSPLCVRADLNFNSHEVTVVYESDVIYAAINDIRLKFAIADIESIVSKIKALIPDAVEGSAGEALEETVKASGLIANALGGMSLDSLIGHLTYLGASEDGNLTVTLSISDFTLSAELSGKDGKLAVNVYNFNYASEISDSSLVMTLSAASGVTVGDVDKSSFVNLADLESYIDPVLRTINERYFDISFSGSVVDTLKAVTTIDGELKIERTEGFADIYAEIVLGGKIGDHNIKIYLLDGTEYSDKEEIPFDIFSLTAYVSYNGFTAKIDCTSALRVLRAFCDILDLHIDAIDELTKEIYDETLDTKVFETMDIVGLDKLRDTINSLAGVAENVDDSAQSGAGGLLALVSDNMLDSVLGGVALCINESGFIDIKINNSLFNALTDDYASVVIGHDGELLSDVIINNLTVNGNNVNFAAALTCDEFEHIAAPSGDVKDFSSIDELLIALIKTAGLREFHITGSINLNLLNIIKPSVPFDVKVKILDDGSTVAAVKLQVPFVSAVVGVALTRSDSYLYFVNNRLYFITDVWDSWAWSEGSYKTTEMKSATVEEFLANPLDYLFFMLRMGSLVKDPITSAMTGGSSGTPSKDINSILKTYAYDGSNFTVKLGLGELAGNSDLNDLNLTLNTTNGYISGLSVDTKFTSANITLSLANTVLANLAQGNDGDMTAEKLGAVSFGKSDAVKSLSGNIDALEDDMAVLFPVEAAVSFGKKAADKATKADRAAEKANESVTRAEECAEALDKEKLALDEAEKKLARIPEGSFGYTRAQTIAELSQKSVARAEADLKAAEAARAATADEATNAAMTAYYYARKAAEFSEKSIATGKAEGYEAAGTSSLNAIEAIEATSRALGAAVKAATAADKDGEKALGRAQSELAYLKETLPASAAQIATAAIASTQASLASAKSAVEDARTSAENAKADVSKWFETVSNVNTALNAVAAMNTASSAATKSAAYSDKDELKDSAANYAEQVAKLSATYASEMADIAVDAANKISSHGISLSQTAVKVASDDPKSAVENMESALAYSEGAQNASAANAAAMKIIADDEARSAAAKEAAETAKNAAHTISDNIMSAGKTVAEKLCGSVTSRADSRANIESSADDLSYVLRAMECAKNVKQFASETAAELLTDIYETAANGAYYVLASANRVIYPIASTSSSTLKAAINKVAWTDYGRSDYSKIEKDAKAVRDAANNFDSDLIDLITSVTTLSDRIFTATVPLLDDPDPVRKLMYATFNGTGTIYAAANEAATAIDGTPELAQHILDEANDLRSSLIGTNAINASKEAVTATNGIKASSDAATSALADLNALYNSLFQNA